MPPYQTFSGSVTSAGVNKSLKVKLGKRQVEFCLMMYAMPARMDYQLSHLAIESWTFQMHRIKYFLSISIFRFIFRCRFRFRFKYASDFFQTHFH